MLVLTEPVKPKHDVCQTQQVAVVPKPKHSVVTSENVKLNVNVKRQQKRESFKISNSLYMF